MEYEKNLLIPDIKKNICKICQRKEYSDEHPSVYGYKNCMNEITCVTHDFRLFKPISFKEAEKILTKEELKELNDNLEKLWKED